MNSRSQPGERIGAIKLRVATWWRALADGPSGASADAVKRLRTWTALVIAVLLGQVLWVSLLAGPRILDRDSVLIMGQVLLGMGLIAIAGLIVSTPREALRLTRQQSHRLILGGAIGLQTLAVLLLWPALSTDIPRYRTDGLAWLSETSPYVTPPSGLAKLQQFDAIDRTVRGPRLPSIYPPVAQTLFITTRAIELAIWGPAKPAVDDPPPRRWRELLPHLSFAQRGLLMRLIAAAGAIGCTYVMLKLLEQRHLTPWLAVLLAWNPLLILEAGAHGSIDVLGILLVLLMLRMMQNGKPALATAALCLACGIKPMAIVLAPLLIRQIWLLRSWQTAQRSIGIVVISLGFIYLPIMLVHNGLTGWIAAMKVYAQSAAGNGALFSLLGGSDVLRLLPALVAIGLLLWIIRRAIAMEDAAYWLLLCILLASPLALPRMVLWPLCFVPLMRHSFGWGALAWSATVGFAFAAWHQPDGQLPAQLLLAQYLPVGLALGVQIRETVGEPAAAPATSSACS